MSTHACVRNSQAEIVPTGRQAHRLAVEAQTVGRQALESGHSLCLSEKCDTSSALPDGAPQFHPQIRHGAHEGHHFHRHACCLLAGLWQESKVQLTMWPAGDDITSSAREASILTRPGQAWAIAAHGRVLVTRRPTRKRETVRFALLALAGDEAAAAALLPGSRTAALGMDPVHACLDHALTSTSKRAAAHCVRRSPFLSQSSHQQQLA